ncbi:MULTISPECIES: hypothetical protein [Streptomyces]|uniref:hypothetical protein n=1 Tax=Streptomyces TaxID=1883 RepID=UPI00345BE8F0
MERTHHTPDQPTQHPDHPKPSPCANRHSIVDKPATVEDCHDDYANGPEATRKAALRAWNE